MSNTFEILMDQLDSRSRGAQGQSGLGVPL